MWSLSLIISIIGTFFKILLWMLGIVLGVALLLLLAVLFVPVRYRAKFVWNEKERFLYAKASWLCSVIRITFRYDNGSAAVAKVFGIPVWTKKPEEKKTEQPETKSNLSEVVEEQAEAKPEQPPSLPIREQEPEQPPEPIHEQEPEQSQPEPIREQEPEQPQPELIREQKPEQQVKPSNVKKESVFSRIKNRLQRLKESIRSLSDRISAVRSFLGNETTKDALTFLKKEGVGILKHILPRSGKGEIILGTDDPAVTGQIFGVIAMFYGRLPKKLTISPSFQEEKFVCDIEVKGRIRLIHGALSALRIYRNQNVKIMIKEAKQLIK